MKNEKSGASSPHGRRDDRPAPTVIPAYQSGRREMLNGLTGQAGVAESVEELLRLQEQHDGFLGAGEARAREIGQELDRLGGMSLMRQVHKQVAANTKSKSYLARELDYAWDGIGDWRG